MSALHPPERTVGNHVRAALLMFQSRRDHTCPGCGRVLLHREPVARLRDLVYHRQCVPHESTRGSPGTPRL